MTKVKVYGAGERRAYANVGEQSEVKIEQGDDLLFYCDSYQVDHLKRKKIHLDMSFSDGREFRIANFFVSDRVYVESIITFDDTLFTRTEIESCLHEDKFIVTLDELRNLKPRESDHLISPSGRVSGGSKMRAMEGSPFVYQFSLSEEFPEDAKVHVFVNGQPLPSWLQLKKLAPRKFIIAGTPGIGDTGEFNLQIGIEGDNT